MLLQKIIDKYKKYRISRFIQKYSEYIKIHHSVAVLNSTSFDIRANNLSGQKISVDEDSMIGCKFVFESDTGKIIIGKRTYIGGGTNLISRSAIIIGNDVTIAWGVWLYDHNSHSLDWQHRVADIKQCVDDYRWKRDIIAGKDWSVVKTAPIHICDKVWIGFNAIILKGVTIGEGAVVGAGAVVTHDVPPWTVVAGNPARVVKKIEPKGNAE